MAALNLAKHIRRLVQRRDRLTRETASKQRQLDAVLSQLAKVQAALPPNPTEAPVLSPLLALNRLPDAWQPFAEKGGAV